MPRGVADPVLTAVATALASVLVACGPPSPAEIAASAELVEIGRLTACVTETARLVVPTGDGGYEGYDVAALEAVAATLDLELAYVETTFDELVSGAAVNEGRCDVGTAGIIAAPDLAPLVDTTAAFRDVHRFVVAPAASAPGSVEAAVVGIEQDGPAADALPALPADDVVEVPSQPDLVRSLATGRVDAVLVPLDAVADVEEAVGRIEVLARVPTGEQTVMVMPRGTDEQLSDAVDSALEDFTSGPAGQEAARRWLHG